MEALGNKTSLKLLKILIDAPLTDFKEIELIKRARTGKGSAGKAINSMVKSHLLLERRIGKTKVICANIQNQGFLFLKTLFDQKKLEALEDTKKAALLLFREKIKDSVDMVIVFGSTVAGTATENSDVDILVVTDKIDEVNRQRKQVEGLFGVRFNLHIYAKDDILKKLKTDTLVYNALVTGVLIQGYGLAISLFAGIKTNVAKNEDAITRLLFFKDRINSASRNYANKDLETAREILSKTLEQITFYLLSEKALNAPSKKDALCLIKSLPEGKLIQSINKSNLKDKISLSESLVINLLKSKIIRSYNGYS